MIIAKGRDEAVEATETGHAVALIGADGAYFRIRTGAEEECQIGYSVEVI